MEKKKSSRFPPLPIFSDSELSPTYPLPPFSSKSKNIQLRNTNTKKRSKPKPGKNKQTKNETCIKQPAAQHPRMRFQRSYQKHITCTHWIKNDDFSHEKLWKHKPDINVEISSSLTCRLLRRTILSFLLQLCYKNKISWNKGYLTSRYLIINSELTKGVATPADALASLLSNLYRSITKPFKWQCRLIFESEFWKKF